MGNLGEPMGGGIMNPWKPAWRLTGFEFSMVKCLGSRFQAE